MKNYLEVFESKKEQNNRGRDMNTNDLIIEKMASQETEIVYDYISTFTRLEDLPYWMAETLLDMDYSVETLDYMAKTLNRELPKFPA